MMIQHVEKWYVRSVWIFVIINISIFKIAQPDRPSIAYIGDGAWGMSLNEIMTCVRENIPTIGVVFNNGQWGAEKKNQV